MEKLAAHMAFIAPDAAIGKRPDRGRRIKIWLCACLLPGKLTKSFGISRLCGGLIHVEQRKFEAPALIDRL